MRNSKFQKAVLVIVCIGMLLSMVAGAISYL